MTGVKPMHLGFGEILQVSLTALGGEEDVLLAPEDDGFGLLFPQKLLLPLDVSAIARRRNRAAPSVRPAAGERTRPCSSCPD